MESPTPTPRKPRRHNKGSQRPEQREPLPALDHDIELDQESTSKDELYGLLGVPSSGGANTVPLTPSSSATLVDAPKRGGLLAISKADIVESKKGRREGKKRVDEGESENVERKKGRRGGKKEADNGEMVGRSDQTDGRTPVKRGGRKAHVVEKGFTVAGTPSPSKPSFRLSNLPDIATRGSAADYSVSGSSSALPEAQLRQSPFKVDDAEFVRYKPTTEAMDMTALSRSLPGVHGDLLANMSKEKGRQRTKPDKETWDMPATTGTEDLTVIYNIPPLMSER
jgi:hypothetical protein